MWNNIIQELKISTVLEKVVLGIIAGIFAVLGYYVGYAHLSNGVNPVLIGSITAFIMMIACMMVSFIGEELLKQAKTEKKEKGPKEPKAPKVKKAKNKESAKTKPEETEIEQANVAKLESNELTDAEDASTGLQMPSEAVVSMAVENSSFKPVKPATVPVKPSEDTQPVTRRQRRIAEAQVKASPKEEASLETKATPVTKESVVPAQEETKDGLTLKEFIAAHPDYAPRKMAREYRAAGGTESTDNILELMS